MVLPAGISPAAWRFEAARSDSLSYGSMKWGRRGDSHSRGADCTAVYETAAVAAEPRRHEMDRQAKGDRRKARLHTCALRRGSLRYALRRWRRLVGRHGAGNFDAMLATKRERMSTWN